MPYADPRENAACQKRLREVAFANGLCKCCRLKPFVPGRTKCQDCLRNARAVDAKRSGRTKTDSFKMWRKNYVANKLQQDVEFNIRHHLRARLSSALKCGYKSGSAVRDLGCSISELKTYLEARFAPGMSWGNYGAWHIDHVVALAKFDLTDREQFLQAVNYKNLQPLWAFDNLSKGCK